MVDRSIGIYINDMIKHTLKVYTLSLALSERDPASAYESIQDSLEKTGLNNIFNLYWDKLVHILKQSLTKIEQTEMYSYLFKGVLSNRYFVFLNGILLFWQKILNEITPSDKIQILELKFQLFDSLTALKDKYLLNINKQLQAQSDQILNVLQEIKKFGKFMNPYTQSQSQTTNQNMSSNNSNSNGQAQQHQHSPNSYENNAINLVTNKLNDLIDTLSIHLNTTQTQLDLKDHIETMIRDLLLNLIQQFIELVYQLNFHGEDLNEHLKFNFVLLDLSKNIDIFLENSSMSDHEPISKQIKRLRKTILKQLLTNLESQISFTLNKMMRSIPIQENVENYDELLSQWRANTSDQVLQYFIPQKIQDYQQMIIDANMSFEQLEKLGEYRNLKVKFSKSLILTFCLLVGNLEVQNEEVQRKIFQEVEQSTYSTLQQYCIFSNTFEQLIKINKKSSIFRRYQNQLGSILKQKEIENQLFCLRIQQDIEVSQRSSQNEVLKDIQKFSEQLLMRQIRDKNNQKQKDKILELIKKIPTREGAKINDYINQYLEI